MDMTYLAHALSWEWACAYIFALGRGHIRAWEQTAAVAGGMGHLGPTPDAFYAAFPALPRRWVTPIRKASPYRGPLFPGLALPTFGKAAVHLIRKSFGVPRLISPRIAWRDRIRPRACNPRALAV